MKQNMRRFFTFKEIVTQYKREGWTSITVTHSHGAYQQSPAGYKGPDQRESRKWCTKRGMKTKKMIFIQGRKTCKQRPQSYDTVILKGSNKCYYGKHQYQLQVKSH